MESSAPALSESPLTFIPKTILRGAMVLQSKWNFFCGHPVYDHIIKLVPIRSPPCSTDLRLVCMQSLGGIRERLERGERSEEVEWGHQGDV